ncbi:Tm-1-like ATP-binding domain-containing protein [Microbacterium thalassium]|nr:Tm-1-like ATP-binding domain-containing protein [Microbacterium thalassium]GLK25751.1 hypothetical protein GCM10017607_30700 [Microbacterium thalassium]
MSDAASSAPRVALLATLDTKSAEAQYVAQQLASRGVRPVIVDMSLRGESPDIADVPRSALMARGATSATGDDRTGAMETTATAARGLLSEWLADGAVDGALGIGGGTGGWMSNRAFESLPFGFPKLVVTTVVKSTGEDDILLLPSVVDVAGTNALLRTVLRNAAGAMAGMVQSVAETTEPRPAIAMTMFGVTTAGGDVARAALEAAGYDVVVFHATGAGGRTMERLTREGRFAGILDWTTTELVQNIAGGLCDAGESRLSAATEAGIPQVVVPGAIDVINVMPPIPDAFAARAHHWHLPTVPLIRSTAEESTRVGRWVAERLAASPAPAAVMIPAKGYSSLDVEGGPFADPDADTAFEEAVREHAPDAVSVTTVPAHINDPDFAREAAQRLLSLIDAANAAPTPKE